MFGKCHVGASSVPGLVGTPFLLWGKRKTLLCLENGNETVFLGFWSSTWFSWIKYQLLPSNTNIYRRCRWLALKEIPMRKTWAKLSLAENALWQAKGWISFCNTVRQICWVISRYLRPTEGRNADFNGTKLTFIWLLPAVMCTIY